MVGETSERSAGAVIFEGDSEKRRFLVLRYREGHWDLVKGHIEGSESIPETAVREAREETGLGCLEFIAGFSERISYSFRRGKGRVTKEVTFLLARTSETEVILSEEHTDFAWLPYEEAVARATFGSAKGVLAKAHDFLA